MRYFLLSTWMILFISIPAVAQESKKDSDRAVNAGLAAYSKAQNISPQEARFRMIKENEAGRMQRILEKEDDFATLKIVHSPEFKIVLYAKGDAQALLSRYTRDPFYVAQTVPRSRKELLDLQRTVGKLLDSQGVTFGSDIDYEMGTIEVLTKDAPKTRRSLFSFMKDHPFIIIRQVSSIVEPLVSTLRGGHRVYASDSCTSGFSVVSAAGVRGILTAAHCGYPATINHVEFETYTGRKWGGNYDEQWFTKAGRTYINEIYVTSSDTMPIIDAEDPILGQTVCKFGRTTFQTCGVVVSANTIVPNDPSGGLLKGTFTRVQNLDSAEYMAREGDSGGPVWTSDGTARGIVFARGGDGTEYEKQMLLQPISRLSAMGVSVATTP